MLRLSVQRANLNSPSVAVGLRNRAAWQGIGGWRRMGPDNRERLPVLVGLALLSIPWSRASPFNTALIPGACGSMEMVIDDD